MPLESSPSPTEPMEPERISQDAGNEMTERQDSSSGATPDKGFDPSKMSREQLLAEYGSLKQKVSDLGRDYNASKQHALSQRQKLDQVQKQLEQVALQNQYAQSQIQQYTNYIQQLSSQKGQQAQSSQQDEVGQMLDDGLITEDEAKAFTDAQIEGNTKITRQVFTRLADRVAQRLQNQQQQQQMAQHHQAAANMAIQRIAGTDITSNQANLQKVWENYMKLASDPLYASLSAQSPNIPVGNQMLNAGLLERAVWQTRLEMASGKNSAEDAAVASRENFVERGSRTPSGPPDSATKRTFNPDKDSDVKKLLTPDEVAYCDRVRKPYKDYFKWMPDAVKQARLDQGRPISSVELGMRIVR